MLSDPKKKQIYDQYGEEGLQAEAQGGSAQGGYRYRRAEDIFSEVATSWTVTVVCHPVCFAQAATNCASCAAACKLPLRAAPSASLVHSVTPTCGPAWGDRGLGMQMFGGGGGVPMGGGGGFPGLFGDGGFGVPRGEESVLSLVLMLPGLCRASCVQVGTRTVTGQQPDDEALLGRPSSATLASGCCRAPKAGYACVCSSQHGPSLRSSVSNMEGSVQGGAWARTACTSTSTSSSRHSRWRPSCS